MIFDEIHHAADDRAWGDAIRAAFEPAGRRLALSGTPFRSDVSAIPFVRYRHEEAVADYEYGYGDALADGGVVRPVYFPRIDGMMEWTAPDGSFHSHGFDDPLDAARAGQRLRTAYSLEGEWLPHVLRQAHDQLLAIRVRQPDAAGLVIATDQDHAKGIVRLLRERLGVRAVVATSDDPEASSHISRFVASTDPWIVAVRMVSEGVDIPRLRVGVFATTTTTELFFRQAVGRLVRWTRGVRGQKAFLFIPDEPRLRARAFSIAEQRRHSLRHDDRELVPRAEPIEEAIEPEQGSFFAPISAVPMGMSEGAEWARRRGRAGRTGRGLVARDRSPAAAGRPAPDPGRPRRADAAGAQAALAGRQHQPGPHDRPGNGHDPRRRQRRTQPVDRPEADHRSDRRAAGTPPGEGRTVVAPSRSEDEHRLTERARPTILTRMCRRKICGSCHKPTWAGCGQHVEQVLAGVAKEDRCSCPPGTPYERNSFWSRLFARN